MSSPAQAIRAAVEPVRTLAFGSISGTYMGIGTPLTNACRILFLQNLTDATLMFSFNGVDDNFPLPSEGFLLLDLTANKAQNGGFFVSAEQRVYVKDLGVPTTGSVYLTAFYGIDI